MKSTSELNNKELERFRATLLEVDQQLVALISMLTHHQLPPHPTPPYHVSCHPSLTSFPSKA